MDEIPECGIGGCKRIDGHRGMHTSLPSTSTQRWDFLKHHEELLHELDWPTPWWFKYWVEVAEGHR